MKNNVSIPKRYDVFLQDLTKSYLQLTFIGYVHTVAEAATMCKVLTECDELCPRGMHTYVFICSELENEVEIK